MKKQEKVMKYVFMACACVSILSVLLICLFLFRNAFQTMTKVNIVEVLFGINWSPTNEPASYGILPMILGSFSVTMTALVIGIPLGVLTAIFFSHYCPPRLYRFAKPAIQLLAGIPSVVYGFFGLVVLVPLVRNYIGGNGSSILTAGILLSIMVLPNIIEVSESSLRSVDPTYLEGAYALGATKEQGVFHIVVPAAKNGILTSIILGMGRAIGETMAVILVAGNQPRIPDSLLKGVRTLTTNIVMEMGYATDTHREVLILTAAVLFIIILGIHVLVERVQKKVEQ